MCEKRKKLVRRALDYFLKHGVAELSLRPLAAEIGTSARLLVYHFGSKEKLIIAVMTELQARIRDSFDQLARARGSGGKKRIMRRFWAWVVRPENTAYFRLLFEVHILALQNPDRYERYLDATSSHWLERIEDSLPPMREKKILATLCAAVVDGLLLEYLSTGDQRRTTRALALFERLIGIAPPLKAREGGKP